MYICKLSNSSKGLKLLVLRSSPFFRRPRIEPLTLPRGSTLSFPASLHAKSIAQPPSS